MSTILLTAYGPYDNWPTNVSEMVLAAIATRGLGHHAITTRVYPVDFNTIREHIAADLASNYDYAIHMGQAPGYAAVTLEGFAVNMAVMRGQTPEEGVPLVPDGAAAYQSQLPLLAWADGLRKMGIPAAVSHHAGTYLCNAALYLSRHETEQTGLKTKSTFLHLPLAHEQGASATLKLPMLPMTTLTAAVRWILQQL